MRLRSIRGPSRLSRVYLPCPSDTEKGSASATPCMLEQRDRTHLAMVRTVLIPHGEGPSPAKHGKRVCSEIPEHKRIPWHGMKRSRTLIGHRKAAVKQSADRLRMQDRRYGPSAESWRELLRISRNAWTFKIFVKKWGSTNFHKLVKKRRKVCKCCGRQLSSTS